MITEGHGRCRLPLLEVSFELELSAQGYTGANLRRLNSLSLPDGVGHRENVRGAGGSNKQHSVIIAKDHVVSTNRPISHFGGVQ